MLRHSSDREQVNHLLDELELVVFLIGSLVPSFELSDQRKTYIEKGVKHIAIVCVVIRLLCYQSCGYSKSLQYGCSCRSNM